MCCSKKISKFILIAFNIVFFLLGAAVLALGVFLLVDEERLLGVIGKIPLSGTFDVESVLSQTSFLKTGAYILIGAGSVVFFIAFSGLCGAIRESKCLLIIYSILVGIILLTEIAAGVVCYVYGDLVELYLEQWLTTLITDHYVGATLGANNVVELGTDSYGVSEAIDFLQVSFQCCGALAYTEFHGATNWPREYNYTSGGSTSTVSSVLVPISCCKFDNPSAWPSDAASLTFVDVHSCLTTADAAATNVLPCYPKLRDELKKYSMIFMGVGCGIAGMEFLGIVAACCLLCSKKKNRTINRTR